MPRKKKPFTDLDLLRSLTSAAEESFYFRKTRRTDLIGIARQYGGKHIPREAYEQFMGITLAEILNKIDNRDE